MKFQKVEESEEGQKLRKAGKQTWEETKVPTTRC